MVYSNGVAELDLTGWYEEIEHRTVGDEPMSEMFTMAIWTVRTGRESAFVDAWATMAQWSENEFAESVDMKLMHNSNNPQEFISLGTWENQESIDRWRGSAEASKLMERVKSMCDKVDNVLLEPVLEIESRGETVKVPIIK